MTSATERCGSETETSASLPLEFEAFFLTNQLRMLKYAVSSGLDRSTAEEAVSDAFVALYTRWDHVLTLTNPVAYLYATVRHSVIDHFRRQRREQLLRARTEETAESEPIEEPDHSRIELLQLIDRLPLRQREIVTLLVAGLDYQEIADMLAIKLSTVRVHLHAARRRLAALLAE
ncbi:sigma-70 family RNA polymerase sigma factor [Kitasatospora aureofaciens]|uniref:RNA polymerase sigma factor n=1 Tax=Kitasatospora aureofaciens TaxID=1894 RepID=UPI0033DFE131